MRGEQRAASAQPACARSHCTRSLRRKRLERERSTPASGTHAVAHEALDLGSVSFGRGQDQRQPVVLHSTAAAVLTKHGSDCWEAVALRIIEGRATPTVGLIWRGAELEERADEVYVSLRRGHVHRRPPVIVAKL